MSKITSIEVQKRNKNRVNMYLDGEYHASFQAELVYKYGLEKGLEIDEEKLGAIIKADNFEKAKNKALLSISKTEKSEKKVREKLESDFDKETIDQVVDFLKKYSLVDDERFAERIVNNDLGFKRVGRNKIKQDLYTKGIQRSDIDKAMENIDEDVELDNAIYLAKKRLKRLKGEEPRKIKNKLYQHLAYKGFGYNTVNTAIRRVMDEDCDEESYNNYD